MPVRIGKQTILLKNMPSVIGNSAVVGKKEGEGPLKNEFDKIYNDEFVGTDSFEKAESALLKEAVLSAIKKSGNMPYDINCCFSGDLLNQCIGSTFGLRDLGISFSGLYGACSTMALSIALSSLLIDGGALNSAVAATVSHFCSAERQYRMPLEYGGQRTPSSQWTVTGAGALILKNCETRLSENNRQPQNTEKNQPLQNTEKSQQQPNTLNNRNPQTFENLQQSQNSAKTPKITAVIIGKIIDLGITDANNMGAAMAPAAADTISRFLEDTSTVPEDFDLILTGDLGKVGSDILKELLLTEHHIDISKVHNDCGLMIFDREKQDVHSGGSGCGCSASVLCSYILNNMKNGNLKRVFFVGTGALLSPTSSLQGESIPGIAHGVLITAE